MFITVKHGGKLSRWLALVSFAAVSELAASYVLFLPPAAS